MRSQSSDYLDRMFGTKSGVVYMAYKAQDESWSEHAFAWPTQRRSLLTWTRNHADSNLFIVPALRGTQRRVKGDAVAMEWLWADVDWEKVPDNKREAIRRRIDQVGTYVVASGSTSRAGANVHVYVKLTREVTVDEHYALNTGLRDYLLADNKQADNSFLRLPGTTNWKTRRGRPVEVRGGHGKAFRPEAFSKIRAFQNAARHVAVDDVSWTKVDVPVKGRRVLRMQSDEARARYGTRHEAVWAVVGDMIRWGFTDDQIHTIMDEFPPALDKADDERGYDVHKDVARRLARRDVARKQAKAIVDGDAPSDDGSAFEELSDEEIHAMGPTNPMVQRILARRAAQREAEQWEQQQHFMAPPDEVSWSARERGEHGVRETQYLIGPRDGDRNGLAGAKHNIILTAQYKTGKTAFIVSTLAQSLRTGTPFLGQFPVPEGGRVVGHWNCEMDGDELYADYVVPAGLGDDDEFYVADLRGYSVNILSPQYKAWTVKWLSDRQVKVWTIDSLARLARMAGVDENDNVMMMALFMAIDEIKVEAGVDVTFIIAHTGRAEQQEGKERARAATVIDDWPDARWVMTRDDTSRFLFVDGRNVSLRTTALDFNHDTKTSTLGVGDKHDVRAVGEVQSVAEIVRANAGINKQDLVKRVCSAVKCRPPRARELITETHESGFINISVVKSPHGGRAAHRHYPVSEGEKRGSATLRRVDMRRAYMYED